MSNLLPHLLHFTDEHRAEGVALQDDLSQFEGELKAAVEQIWKKSDQTEGDVKSESWAARMEAKEKDKQTDPIDRVEKPGVSEADWEIKLFHW